MLEDFRDSPPLRNKVFSLGNIVPADACTALQDYVQELGVHKHSTVFDRFLQQETFDLNIRNSKAVTVHDQKTLSFVSNCIIDAVATKLNLSIKLARDHVTVINKYNEEGGFFEWHNDFEKYKINDNFDSQEMHLIYCISGCQEGGEFEVEHVAKFSEACTAGGVVMFDKLMKHRALEVKKGAKVILTIDVLVSVKIKTTELTRASNKLGLLFEGTVDNICVYSLDNFVGMVKYLQEQNKLHDVCPFMYFSLTDDENDVTCALFDASGMQLRSGGKTTLCVWKPPPKAKPKQRINDMLDQLFVCYNDVSIQKDDTTFDESLQFLKSLRQLVPVFKLEMEALEHVLNMKFNLVDCGDGFKNNKMTYTYHCNGHESNYEKCRVTIIHGFVLNKDEYCVQDNNNKDRKLN